MHLLVPKFYKCITMMICLSRFCDFTLKGVPWKPVYCLVTILRQFSYQVSGKPYFNILIFSPYSLKQGREKPILPFVSRGRKYWLVKEINTVGKRWFHEREQYCSWIVTTNCNNVFVVIVIEKHTITSSFFILFGQPPPPCNHEIFWLWTVRWPKILC